MKSLYIASLSLALFVSLGAGVNANPLGLAPWPQTKILLVQKLQPVMRSFPGLSADILGIRTGMSVTEAETVAGKTYGATVRPGITRLGEVLTYRPGDASPHGVVIHTPRFIADIVFNRIKANMSDILSLYFSSPVTGNSLLAASRTVTYFQDLASQQSAPAVSTLKNALIKKYGPTSTQSQSRDGGLSMEWAFNQKGRVICETGNCGGDNFTGTPRTFSSPILGNEFLEPCGTTAKYQALFRIVAKIDINSYVKDEVSNFTVFMWDTPTCMNDGKAAKQQLTAAALKFYKEKY